jgi:hypothetical protein
MTRTITFLVGLLVLLHASGPLILAQSQTTKSKSHTVVKTKGSVKISKKGDKSILTIDMQKEAAKSKSYTVDGDYEVVTDGVVRETTVGGQRIVEVVSVLRSTKGEKLSNDCSGPCCLAGDDTIGYQCLHGAQCIPKACRLISNPGNRYCTCQ